MATRRRPRAAWVFRERRCVTSSRSTTSMARWPRSWHRRLLVQHAATLAAVALASAVLVGVPLYVLAAALLEHALDDRLEGIAELAAVGLASTNGSTGS